MCVFVCGIEALKQIYIEILRLRLRNKYLKKLSFLKIIYLSRSLKSTVVKIFFIYLEQYIQIKTVGHGKFSRIFKLFFDFVSLKTNRKNLLGNGKKKLWYFMLNVIFLGKIRIAYLWYSLMYNCFFLHHFRPEDSFPYTPHSLYLHSAPCISRFGRLKIQQYPLTSYFDELSNLFTWTLFPLGIHYMSHCIVR